MKKIIKSVFIVASVLVFSSCNGDSSSSVNKSKTVVCTTGVIADAMKNILPPTYDVKALMGPGVDPHTYKSKSSDLKGMMSADAIVYNGIHFEANLIEALENISKSNFVVAMGDLLPKEKLRATTDFGTNYDPHYWHDVVLFAESVKLTGKQFSSEFKNDSAFIDSATSSYVSQLLKTAESVSQKMKLIPDSSRVIITAHDAFGYFGNAFNIEVKGVQGISTSSDISIRGITELTDLIVKRNIPAIFVENSVSDKNIQSVIEGCSSKGLELKRGGVLYSDGLGDKSSGADTYIKMINKNTETIVSALKQ